MWRIAGAAVLTAGLVVALTAEPALAGTDSKWVYTKDKAAKARFYHYGDWLQVCDLKKNDGWFAGAFMVGLFSDKDEKGAVVTSKPGKCAKLAHNYVLPEGYYVRVKVCKVRKRPWKVTGCSGFVLGRA